MLETLAKTAVIGSVISLFRRRQQASMVNSIALVAAGVVVGAGAALMLAPKSGAELRGDIRSRARKLTGDAKKLGAEAGERINAAREAVSREPIHH
ncbi:MAG TPA: YtxH domain-containing protein [Myxococcota bacterium]|jgi:gas vesicle protein